MTLDAILARHAPVTDDEGYIVCRTCIQIWGEDGCDAHQLGVALEEAKVPWQYVIDDLHATSQRLEAAEAREQRLRAELARYETLTANQTEHIQYDVAERQRIAAAVEDDPGCEQQPGHMTKAAVLRIVAGEPEKPDTIKDYDYETEGYGGT